MRILMIIWHYPPAVGGSERMAARLAGALAHRGHEIEVWTSYRADSPPVERPARGLTIRRRMGGLELGPLFGASVWAREAGAIWWARRRFDVVHLHEATWPALGAVAARAVGGPPVLVMNASSGVLNDVRRLRERRAGSLLTACLRRADRFVALCRQARDEMTHLGIAPDRIEIVPNGLALGDFLPPAPDEERTPEPDSAAAAAGLEEGSAAAAATAAWRWRFVTFVGRLHPIKNVPVLLEAFARVRRERPAARLRIVGDGEERPALLRRAGELGLRTLEQPGLPPCADSYAPLLPGRASLSNDQVEAFDVQFAGMSADPRPDYAAADVVVLPSATEGMSNVLLEAMAMARPIVASAVGGNPDLLDPEDRRASAPDEEKHGVVAGANGLLVPAGDAEALASAIGRVLDDVALRRTLGVSARQFIERNCSLEQVASRYEEIYQQLAGTRRRTPRSGR